MQIRICDQPVAAPHHKIDMLIALNAETCALHKKEMAETGLVLLDVDAKKTSENDAEEDDSQENLPEEAREKNVLPVAFSQMAKDAGGKIMANTVAAGACPALLGAPFSAFEQILKIRFAEKEKTLENNITAGRSGFDAVNTIIGASYAGVRALTATSGGGVSLMTEGLGLAGITEPPIVIINDSLWVTTREIEVPKEIERFATTDEDMTSPSDYKRFAVTASGISPRALPCKGLALVCATANEHDETGHMSETIAGRNTMVEKRQAKTKGMTGEMTGPKAYHAESESLLVGWETLYYHGTECLLSSGPVDPPANRAFISYIPAPI